MPTINIWRNKRKRIKLKQSELVNYIDNLGELTDDSLKYLFKHTGIYNRIKMMYMVLKYKFGFVPNFEHLKIAKNNWFRIILEVLDLIKNKNIFFEYIKNMEINDNNIKFVTKIMRINFLSGIFYEEDIVIYILEKINEYPAMVELLEIIINKNKEKKDNKYLDTIVNNAKKSYIYEFNTQKQLFNYIDKIKMVKYRLISKNKKLFTNEELYNFLIGKKYQCDITKYVLQIKKPTLIDIKLLEVSSCFDKKQILPIIKILNKYPFLYQSINLDYFYNGKYNFWYKARIFEYILYMVQNYDFTQIDSYYGFFEKELKICDMFITLESRLNDDNLNNYYDPNLFNQNSIKKILDNYQDIIIFCMYIGIKNSSKQEIYNYLERIINILDEQWIYKNNINYKCFERIFYILVDNI